MKVLFLLLLSFGISSGMMAQNTPTVNWNDVEVKDTTGKLYSLVQWQQLVSSGKYSMRMQADMKSATLVKLSEQEINKRFEMMPKPMESKFFKTGDKISSFSERDMNGNRYTLKQLVGKVVVLNFWFINCPPCRMEIPELNEMLESYKNNKDVVFIAIALDEKSELQKFLKTIPYNYNIIDNGRYISAQYGVTSYPTHVVIDKEGKISFHTSGLSMATVHWLKKSIDIALAPTAAK